MKKRDIAYDFAYYDRCLGRLHRIPCGERKRRGHTRLGSRESRPTAAEVDAVVKFMEALNGEGYMDKAPASFPQ